MMQAQEIEKEGRAMVVGDVTTAVDVLVLGSGPAGYVAAIRAAQLGRFVTLVEPGPMGGTCLNRGCIPLKALVSSSERYYQTRQEELAMMGIEAEAVSFDWTKMQAWKESVVDRLSDGVRRLLSGNKVEIVIGTGWFLNEKEVRVEGENGSLRFKFEQCIIATGGEARPVPDLPYDGKEVLTPEQALQLPQLPATIAVHGDDYIALELASVLARLGVGVKLYTPGEQLLVGVDAAALRLVQAGLRKMGVQIVPKTAVAQVVERPLVVSNGVKPRTDGLHLAATKVQLNEQGGIAVNSMQQSSVAEIYAVGDCTGGRALATIAIKQAKVAAEVIAGQRVQFAPLVMPLVVHTTPELATVGYSAQDAVSAGYKVVTGRYPFAANGRSLTLAADNGVALVVADADNGAIIGATFVGPRAGDLIGQATLAIEMGATLTDLSEVLYAHPSLNETLQESSENALGKAIHILARRE